MKSFRFTKPLSARKWRIWAGNELTPPVTMKMSMRMMITVSSFIRKLTEVNFYIFISRTSEHFIYKLHHRKQFWHAIVCLCPDHVSFSFFPIRNFRSVKSARWNSTALNNVLELYDGSKPILREMCTGISANACLLMANKIYFFDFIIFFFSLRTHFHRAGEKCFKLRDLLPWTRLWEIKQLIW